MLPQELVPKPRLMVVDDEPSSVKAVRKHLLDAGYEDVIVTSDPTKAVEIIGNESPDLLLLDIIMPKVNGLEVLTRLRSEERFRHLPIIILTASTELHVKARALALGVTDFLQKPIDPTELIPRIRNALSIKALRRHCQSLAIDGTDERPGRVPPAGDDRPVEVETDVESRPELPEGWCPTRLSWPVLRRTWFRELKSSAKVMIVDDEPVNVRVVRKYLSNEGYTNFITTTDAMEAIGLMESETPDVVLLDIMMPRLSGLEILERVRADERFMDLPVIILTAATDQETKRQALDLGATEFLTKPIDALEILPRVRNSLVMKFHQDQIKDYARKLELEVSHQIEKVRDYAAALERANEVLRRSRSAAQAANQLKSQFLANMSHEIRTPLSAMIGFAEIMLAEADSKAISDQDVAALDTIVRNGRHLLEVVNDILDLSKIEAGQLEIETIACSPAEILSEILQSTEMRANNKGLALQVQCATSIPQRIQTDPTCLRRILINLIGNAVKFTEEGSVQVIVSLLRCGDEEPRLQFEVVDTGVGIGGEQLSKLFQPFVQGNVAVRRKYGGTGLGLVISRQLAQRLGGNLTVESKLGCGSTFRLAIPVGPLDDVEMVDDPAGWGNKTAEAPPAAPDPCLTKNLDCRILLAEDCVDNQRLISLLLRKAGAEVVVVEHGQAAYDKVEEATKAATPFDLVLMDMQMPVLDGYAATRKLRQAGYTLPIIAVTAHAMAGEREKCLAAGCDDYAAKPITRARLLNTVARHVKQHALGNLS